MPLWKAYAWLQLHRLKKNQLGMPESVNSRKTGVLD